MKVKSLSRVWLLAAPWTAAYQAPLSLGFSRQEYWDGSPLPSPISAASIVLFTLPVISVISALYFQQFRQIQKEKESWILNDQPANQLFNILKIKV